MINTLKRFYFYFQNKPFRKFYNKYKEYTMVPENVFIDNLKLVQLHSDINGDIVECGVWRGGMIAAISEIMEGNRKSILFDSFEGLPEVKEIDGVTAKEWQTNTTSDYYFDNCKAEIEWAQKAMTLSSVENYQLIKGWFSETLKDYDSEEKIAVLRLDGDWYESTMDCLVHLYPKVAVGGIIIIDDYHLWDGCSKAVHDYLSTNQLSDRIKQFNNGVIHYIIKT